MHEDLLAFGIINLPVAKIPECISAAWEAARAHLRAPPHSDSGRTGRSPGTAGPYPGRGKTGF